MKHIATLALLIPLVGCTLPAQSSLPPERSYSTSAAVASVPMFTGEQLEQLVGPIALYPDALIALILPASTNGSDIVLAARYLQSGGDPEHADTQPWDDSVQSLVRYPDVIKWMDENLAWTKQLGDAFTTQPNEVMNAIQQLRQRARAAGILKDTPQQQIVYQQGVIMIIPAQPDVIYVPYYDPDVVFVPYGGYSRYYSPDFFTFSTGFASGWWLSYGLDWHSHRIWNIHRRDREQYWRDHHRDWHRHGSRPSPTSGKPAPEVHTWRPRPNRGAPYAHRWHRPGEIVHPRPPRPGTGGSGQESHGRIVERRTPVSTAPGSTNPAAAMVGPTAPIVDVQPAIRQPLTTPPTVPRLRQVTPSESSRSSRFGDRRRPQQSPDSGGSRATDVVGPTAPSSTPTRSVVAPRASSSGGASRHATTAAPGPRLPASLNRPSPSPSPSYTPQREAAPAPRPAPSLSRVAPAPRPAPSMRHSSPSSQQAARARVPDAPRPAPAMRQSSPSSYHAAPAPSSAPAMRSAPPPPPRSYSPPPPPPSQPPPSSPPPSSPPPGHSRSEDRER